MCQVENRFNKKLLALKRNVVLKSCKNWVLFLLLLPELSFTGKADKYCIPCELHTKL